MQLSPNTFENSAGILSTPSALFFFISPIADTISLSNKSGPLQSSFMSPSLPKTISPGFGFPFLSYSVSIYSFHLFRTSSGSVSNLPVSSLIVVHLLLTFFLSESFLTFEYFKSDRPLASSSSSSLHSLSHHFF